MEKEKVEEVRGEGAEKKKSVKKKAGEKAEKTSRCKTERVGGPRRSGCGRVRMRTMLERLSSGAGTLREELEREYETRVNASSRVSRHFRDGLHAREHGKITEPGVVVYDRSRFKLANSASSFINASRVKTWKGGDDIGHHVVETDRVFEAVYVIQNRNIKITAIILGLAFLVIFFFSRTLTVPWPAAIAWAVFAASADWAC